ncbi:MAG TPA: BREX-1 system adenine-specific DNA-methyltransferase PglX [Clostridiaceae bacterium]|nr:BREX-1 system adenine-specific DNA-methyltransferase PglX [Clostridiaceae bacterium]
MDKTAIKNFAVWARDKLISDVRYKAGMIGITENGIADKLPQSTKDLHFFDIGTKDYVEISGKEISQRNDLIRIIKQKEKETGNYKEAFNQIVEEVAYTWFNRLIAIRFMEVNDYLPSGVRVLSSDNKEKIEPDFVTHPFDTYFDFTADEKDKIIELKVDNKLDELFRLLFIKECNHLNKFLPELFEKTNDYSELLLTISFTDRDGIVYRLVNDIDEDDFNVEKEGQIEIIGWLYQYYNTVPKELINARPKSVKIKIQDIPAVTQLFTPEWIVKYMVENSLGRIWQNREPSNSLKSNWDYYLDEAEQEPEVSAKLDEIKKIYKNLNPENIKLIDPCMGSGHILVYAFDVFMQIYESCGYTQRDAAVSILENNLYGLDIDKRAYQLAYFAVMMKARQYNRRIFEKRIEPNLSYFKSSESVSSFALNQLEKTKDIASILLDESRYADEYGSLLNISLSYDDLNNLEEELKSLEDKIKKSILPDDMEFDILLTTLKPLVKQAKIFVRKYEVVVTNPPYLGSNAVGARLSDYLKTNFPDSKADLFACFLEKGISMTSVNGMSAMVTMQSWMFLSSFEKMRKRLLKKHTLTNFMHMNNMVMGIAFGTAVSVFLNNRIRNYKGTYNAIKYEDLIDNKPRAFPIKENRFVQISTEDFSKIPGQPIAYWASKNIFKAFENGKKMETLLDVKQGLATADNNRFLRLWYEVEIDNCKFDSVNAEDLIENGKKWIPYNKGGQRRQWYGNYDYLVNWENDGYEIRNFNRAVIRNQEYHFKEAITWGLITSGGFSIRYRTGGGIHDVSGMSAFYNGSISLKYILGLMSTPIADKIFKMLNPTINLQVGDFKNFPVLTDDNKESKIVEIVEQCLDISKTDWDSFETSWDFSRHPLLNGETTLQKSFEKYMLETNSRFDSLKVNEEELNRIFIDIYGLEDELTPEVSDKDITVAKIFNDQDDIYDDIKGNAYILTKEDVVKSFISYAVGCIFGRYSLDVEGLAYAGGDWDDSKYQTFIPDNDNCVPITDTEYLEDDIVGLFSAWLKKVYGKETFEENLDFIADALGTRGNTSREKIRNYFLKDFIKDHNRIYKKRPIYWMFDSGRNDGFKALCYIHRWTEDTIGHMRVEYLHRIQRIYENEINQMDNIIEQSSNNREISRATKTKTKLQKQLQETKDYDVKMGHLANARIGIDLDDGVKVNYEKVQTASDGKKIQILAKI